MLRDEGGLLGNIIEEPPVRGAEQRKTSSGVSVCVCVRTYAFIAPRLIPNRAAILSTPGANSDFGGYDC